VHLATVPCWPIDTTYYISPPNAIDINFLYYLLAYSNLGALDKSTAIPGLNRDDVYGMPIPLPPLPEQHRIVEEIERRFSVADQIEKIVDHSLKQAERLRQSILKRAFEGRLVLQDPNDEPAEKLLERIRQERARLQAERKPATKRGNNKPNTEQMRLV
jgi:type I restriction enzyme S subunit